ncbi:succinate dehydrogenase cytochrome b558 subunit [Chengkuizengella axinellae]|uniref:Succinate dehydrogenase cytochrome b558 subunit n=1 Tax=Chengkuizengella axinellae TaxID=3064388 RepID=A0ABT9ITB7_9BACL|nr:succinate dehydrogenase cytochrome b558 subunit [Chengkuizengella sp. 2205SS18-9]MDP5272591.1 succinate dehydrogenase cytochrome b558 subunit [Chengkuizengella sp. 2205SS18-9]
MKLNSFYSRKLHSLLGVIPLGLFLVEHMLTNYEAFSAGKEGFIEQVVWLNSLPLVLFLEIFGIWLPLLYHGVYGLYIAFQAKHNVNNYGYVRNHMFMWQRITGVITLIFVVWHFSDTRLQVALGNIGHEDLAAHMHNTLSSPIWFALYIVGIIAASFHFSNGMWSFLVSWGITVGPRAQRVSSYIWMGVFVILSVLFVLALTAFTDESFAFSTLESVQNQLG